MGRTQAVERKESTLNYTPRGDRVIVKRLERPQPSEEQLFIPKSQQKDFNEGVVVAVGPEILDLAVGDQVCFLDFAGTEVEVDGELYLSLMDSEIHGVRK